MLRNILAGYDAAIHDRVDVQSLHLSLLDQVAGSAALDLLVRSYRRSFNGFAAQLSDAEAKRIASMDGVVSVIPNKLKGSLKEKMYSSNDEVDDDDDEDEEENERDGIIKFSEGCKAFRTVFLNIINKYLQNDPLGPILSAHKKLVAEKLLEEETEHKYKGEARKEKHLAGEKGHIKPASFLDTKEELLISIATKGVVKLFNAVNKAQNPQKVSTTSRSKHVKELAKQRKETFFSELKKSTTEASALNSSKVRKSLNRENDDGPGWAPLRDSYMLTNSKLNKDWDKMPDPATTVDQGRVPLEGSSDED